MPSPVKKLKCITKEGVKVNFFYDCQFNGEETIFRVNDNENITISDFFLLIVIKFDENTVRIDQINNHRDPRLSAKGIPYALIPEIHCILKKKIVSSTNKNVAKQKEEVLRKRILFEKSEWRTPDADKIWERLKSWGLAKYNVEEDRYNYKPPLFFCFKRWLKSIFNS